MTKVIKKVEYVNFVELKVKVDASQLLLDLISSKVSLEQVLLQLGNYYMFEGASALTGLPLVTNADSVKSLENALICKYVLNNWDEIKKLAFKDFGRVANKGK